MRNEKTSKKVQRIAAKGIKKPESLTPEEVKAVCASALTQSADVAEPERLPVEQFFDRILVKNKDGAREMWAMFNETEKATVLEKVADINELIAEMQ